MRITVHNVVHNTVQSSSSDNFPLILQTIIIAQMMSTGGDGKSFVLFVIYVCILILAYFKVRVCMYILREYRII